MAKLTINEQKIPVTARADRENNSPGDGSLRGKDSQPTQSSQSVPDENFPSTTSQTTPEGAQKEQASPDLEQNESNNETPQDWGSEGQNEEINHQSSQTSLQPQPESSFGGDNRSALTQSIQNNTNEGKNDPQKRNLPENTVGESEKESQDHNKTEEKSQRANEQPETENESGNKSNNEPPSEEKRTAGPEEGKKRDRDGEEQFNPNRVRSQPQNVKQPGQKVENANSPASLQNENSKGKGLLDNVGKGRDIARDPVAAGKEATKEQINKRIVNPAKQAVKTAAKEGVKKGIEAVTGGTGVAPVEAIDKAATAAKKVYDKADEITGGEVKKTSKVLIIIAISVPILSIIGVIALFTALPTIWRGSQTADLKSTQDATIINEIGTNVANEKLVFTDPKDLEDIKAGNALRPTLKILNFLAQKHTKLTVTMQNEGMGFDVTAIDSIKCISSTGEKLPEIPIVLDYNYNWTSKIAVPNPDGFDCAVGYYPNADSPINGQYSNIFGPGVFKLSELKSKGPAAAQEKIAEIISEVVSINKEQNIDPNSDDNLLPEEIVVDSAYMNQNIARGDNNTLALVLHPNITAAHLNKTDKSEILVGKTNPKSALTINYLK